VRGRSGGNPTRGGPGFAQAKRARRTTGQRNQVGSGRRLCSVIPTRRQVLPAWNAAWPAAGVASAFWIFDPGCRAGVVPLDLVGRREARRATRPHRERLTYRGPGAVASPARAFPGKLAARRPPTGGRTPRPEKIRPTYAPSWTHYVPSGKGSSRIREVTSAPRLIRTADLLIRREKVFRVLCP
jgi:hypothetical protein